jgi:hypothetical protein
MFRDHANPRKPVSQRFEAPQRLTLLCPVADIRNDTAVDEARVIGRVTDQQQRVATASPSDEQAHGTGRVPRSRQERESTVSEDVVRAVEVRERGIVRRSETDRPPLDARCEEVLGEDAVHVRRAAGEDRVLGLADEHRDARGCELADVTSMVVVKVGDGSEGKPLEANTGEFKLFAETLARGEGGVHLSRVDRADEAPGKYVRGASADSGA